MSHDSFGLYFMYYGGDDTPELFEADFTPFAQDELIRLCYGNDYFTWGGCEATVYDGNITVKYS